MNLSELVEVVDSIVETSRISEVFEVFKAGKDVMAVVDEAMTPRGILREADLKKYVYASFGREIIRNKPVSMFAMPCEIIPHDFDVDTVLRRVESEFPVNGFIVTRQGRYAGMLKKDSVLKIYEVNRKSNEQQIMQLQRIESLGTLAGGIAHELNNMLMPIMGNAELGLEEAAEGSVSSKAFRRILAAARRSSEIVSQILAFSRPDISEKALVHPAEVVREVVGFIKASLPSTIVVQTEYADRDGIVLADSTQLHQVILNVCTNASHAMNNAGALSISVAEFVADPVFCASHEGALEGEFIRITVADTGCGIAEEVRRRMFEPFFTTKEVGQGTGLGLSVVLGIIRGHGGFLTVETEVGVGSAFHIHLPRAGEGEIASSRDKGAPSPGTAKILFVDDEPPILHVAREYLSRLGYTVVTTTDGRRGLEMFRAAPTYFNLVITDQTMPEMTGDELIRQLRQVSEGVPIILCSGNAALTLGPLATETGANLFIQKPVSLLELAASIAGMLNNPESGAERPAEEGRDGSDTGDRRRGDDAGNPEGHP